MSAQIAVPHERSRCVCVCVCVRVLLGDVLKSLRTCASSSMRACENYFLKKSLMSFTYNLIERLSSVV